MGLPELDQGQRGSDDRVSVLSTDSSSSLAEVESLLNIKFVRLQLSKLDGWRKAFLGFCVLKVFLMMCLWLAVYAQTFRDVDVRAIATAEQVYCVLENCCFENQVDALVHNTRCIPPALSDQVSLSLVRSAGCVAAETSNSTVLEICNLIGEYVRDVARILTTCGHSSESINMTDVLVYSNVTVATDICSSVGFKGLADVPASLSSSFKEYFSYVVLTFAVCSIGLCFFAFAAVIQENKFLLIPFLCMQGYLIFLVAQHFAAIVTFTSAELLENTVIVYERLGLSVPLAKASLGLLIAFTIIILPFVVWIWRTTEKRSFVLFYTAGGRKTIRCLLLLFSLSACSPTQTLTRLHRVLQSDFESSLLMPQLNSATIILWTSYILVGRVFIFSTSAALTTAISAMTVISCPITFAIAVLSPHLVLSLKVWKSSVYFLMSIIPPALVIIGILFSMQSFCNRCPLLFPLVQRGIRLDILGFFFLVRC